jgi:hypothetical protein
MLPAVPAVSTSELEPSDEFRETRLARDISTDAAKETRLAGAATTSGGHTSAASSSTGSSLGDILKKIPPITQWPVTHYVGAVTVVLLVVVVSLAVARFSDDTPTVVQNEIQTEESSPPADPGPTSSSVPTLTTPSSGTPPQQTQPTTRNLEQIPTWIAVARKYLSENKLTTPPGDNALAYCDRVLAVVPQHAEALHIKEQIAERYVEWGDAQMQQGNHAKAREYYRQSLDIISPNTTVSNKLAAVERELAQQRPLPTQGTTTPRPDPVAPPVTQPSTQNPTVSEPVTKTPEEEKPSQGPARTVRLRSNTEVTVALTQALRSEQNYAPNQTIQFRVTQDVIVDGVVVIPRNSPAFGEIRETQAGEGRQKGVIDFKINAVQAADGSQISLKTATFKEVADRGENIRFDSGQTFIVRIARTTELTIR